MLKAFLNIFKVPELRKRFLFTIGVMVIFRVGAQITVPGVNLISFLQATGHAGGSPFDFLSLFTGGAKEYASIFSLGVMPYITSSIIMQLLQSVIPSLKQMVKEGPEGRKKLHQYGRYGTVLVCIIQGFIYARGMVADSQAGSGYLTMGPVEFMIIFTLAVTAGSLILMWMGEQITERGIGNGISLIIMVNIIARLPHSIYNLFDGIDKGAMDPMNIVIILAMFFIVIGLVVFEEQGLRKIPIQYANRMVGSQSYSGQVSFLPFKVNPTGVIPIIFASSILLFPSQLAGWFGGKIEILNFISNNMLPGKALYSAVYFIMIIFFAYFYMEVELSPHDIAENLRRQGGFVPGVRPGQQTEEHISFILRRITLPGALFLGIIALVPTFVISGMNVPSNLAYLMGGTSLLIMVGVALDTLKQIESHLLMHHLDGFLTKSKTKR